MISLTLILAISVLTVLTILRIGLSLLIAGLRCVGQSVLVASILHSYILKEFQYVHWFYIYSNFIIFMQLNPFFFSRENKDKIEIYWAFGTTRLEACKPIANQALKLVLLPLITSMKFSSSFPMAFHLSLSQCHRGLYPRNDDRSHSQSVIRRPSS